MAEEKLSKPSYMEGNSREDAKAITQGASETKQVVQGKVTVKKKPAAKRLRESLGLEETRTVGDYLVWDVLLPAAKEMVADLVKKGIDVFLYGGTSSAPSSRKNGRGHVSYEGYYSSKRNGDYKSERRVRAGSRYAMDFREFVFEDRRDAEMVLSELCEIIDTYGFAKLSDFYSLVGESERTFTDHGYGWDALGSASVERTRDGWILDMPRPIPLN
jgi:hypothetical protein